MMNQSGKHKHKTRDYNRWIAYRMFQVRQVQSRKQLGENSQLNKKTNYKGEFIVDREKQQNQQVTKEGKKTQV